MAVKTERDHLAKPVPEASPKSQTILDFTAAKDDGGTNNLNS